MTRIFIYADDHKLIKNILLLEKEANKYLADYETHNRNINDIKFKSVDKLNDELKEMENKIYDIEKEKEKMNNKIKELERQQVADTTDLENKIKNVIRKRRKGKISKEIFKQQLTSLNAKIQQAKTQHVENPHTKQEIAKLENEIKNIDNQKKQFENKINLISHKINEARKQKLNEYLNSKEGKELTQSSDKYKNCINKATELWKSHLTKHIGNGNSVAESILRNGYTGAIGGYAGYSMSNSALNARENLSKPLSAWTSKDAQEFSQIIGKKITLKELKDFLKYNGDDGWHHTSNHFNKTNFYSLPKAMHGYDGELNIHNLAEALKEFK